MCGLRPPTKQSITDAAMDVAWPLRSVIIVIMQAAKMMRTAGLMSFLALLSVCCCASAVSPHPFPGAAIHLGNAQLED